MPVRIGELGDGTENQEKVKNINKTTSIKPYVSNNYSYSQYIIFISIISIKLEIPTSGILQLLLVEYMFFSNNAA